MNLESLEADREINPTSTLALPEQEICDRYEKIFTAAVNDALREKRLTNQTLPNGLMPLRERMKAARLSKARPCDAYLIPKTT